MKFIIFLVCLFGFLSARAQLNGVVYGSNKKSKEPIYGAKVRLVSTGKGAITNEEGKFELILPKELPDTLVFSAMGYYNDTVVVDKKDRFIAMEVVLYSDQLLPEVVVSYKKGTHSISRLKTLLVEEISSGELRKAACCNLSESFETNASVDVNITDAVSGAKKIQMMGLDGVYTQIQMENTPYLRGLETSFGLNSIPGTWIESIQITKGTGNVVNGFESMAGLINLQLKSPESSEALFVNGYVNAMARSELNINTGFRLNDKWSSAWMVHGAIHPIEMDYNNDGFRDMPNGSIAAVLNRYQFEGDKMEAQFGFNAYIDNKEGGQLSRQAGEFQDRYLMNLDSKHIDLFAKTGFFLSKPMQSIGLVYNLKYQELDALYGLREFRGRERRGYFNAIYDGYFGNTMHKFKSGLSFVYSDLEQQMDTLNDDRLEYIPGIFAEYTYTGARLNVVAGIRADHHNLFGEQFVPRLHTKYALNEWLDLRLTGGKGWRVPNYMIDNISLLANSRTWIAPQQVLPEISWNVGGSFAQRFKLFGQEGSLTLDFYHTNFERQLVVDRDENLAEIRFKNLEGRSFSNSFQAELAFSPAQRLDIRFAYKYLDVRAEFASELQQRVMVPKHRGFANIAYVSRNKRWEYDLTCSVFGSARLPVVMLPEGSQTTENQSEVFPLVNAQIIHNFKKFEVYLGGENILHYRQNNPIIDAQNPFSQTFNATRVWGPVFGANVYAGFRFSIEQKEK
jgi:outer membrane receptor protein involved in Fe transport